MASMDSSRGTLGAGAEAGGEAIAVSKVLSLWHKRRIGFPENVVSSVEMKGRIVYLQRRVSKVGAWQAVV